MEKKQLKILLMGGTKDSINIIKFLKKELKNSYILATTTTDYGGLLAKDAGCDDTISKSLDVKKIMSIIENKSIDMLIDSTHPFAVNGTKNAIESAKKTNIDYIRFEREKLDLKYTKHENIHLVESFEAAGKLINEKWNDKNILHLAGINTVETILNYVNKENLFIRVLPVRTSIEKCEKLGINSSHIIAIQGIFSKEFNKILMEEYNSEIIITKESGKSGGTISKLLAAKELKLPVVLIDRPKIAILKSEDIVTNLNHLKEKITKT